ncbi:hypothetical protein [Mucilaginibacter gossypiicola]|uniref:hypothetical protein n=1 Tax=Mucilaginibacter gossypiicola TaxID=551995 RepID=UPI00115FD12D|nr:hypothetical protein [Mucilaginibacter gossypiicola]
MKSLLNPFIFNGPNVYAVHDNKYTTSAATATIKGFGPSGSLKKRKSSLEQTIAATAKIINEIVFDLKYRFAMLLPMCLR